MNTELFKKTTYNQASFNRDDYFHVINKINDLESEIKIRDIRDPSNVTSKRYTTISTQGVLNMLVNNVEQSKLEALKTWFHFDDNDLKKRFFDGTTSYSGVLKKINDWMRKYETPLKIDVIAEQDEAEIEGNIWYLNAKILWGDGTSTNVTEDVSRIYHSYDKAGKYTITIHHTTDSWDPEEIRLVADENMTIDKIYAGLMLKQALLDGDSIYAFSSSYYPKNKTVQLVWMEALPTSGDEFGYNFSNYTKFYIGNNGVPVNDTYLSETETFYASNYENATDVTIQIKDWAITYDDSTKYDKLTNLTIYPYYPVFVNAVDTFSHHTAKVTGSTLTILKGKDQDKCYNWAVENHSADFDNIVKE